MGGRRVAPVGQESVPDGSRFTPDTMQQLTLFDEARPATFGAYALAWHGEYCVPPWVTPHTSRVRLSLLRARILPRVGHLYLHEITTEVLTAWQLELLRELKPQSVRHLFFTGLGPILRRAFLEGLIPVHPMARMRWPRIDPAPPEPYTDADVDLLIGWFRQHKPAYEPLVALVCLAGLRPSEACALRWGDVQGRKVLIERAAVDGLVGRTKTQRSVRRIQVSRRLDGILRRCRGRAEDYIGADGQVPVRSRSIGGYWCRRACRDLGIEHRGLYAGRRHAISAAITDGASLGLVAAYCGTSISKIERHYYRYLGGLTDPREAAKRKHVA
jgi:integrase